MSVQLVDILLMSLNIKKEIYLSIKLCILGFITEVI